MDLVTTISYIFKDVAAVVSLLMIMHYVFLDRFKFKPIKTILIFAVIIANAFIGIFVLTKAYQDTADLMDFISNVICILSVRFLTEQKRTVKIIWITMLYLMTVEMVFSLVSPYIYKKLFVEYFITGIMFSVVGVFIYIFSVKSRYNFLPKVFDEIPRWVFVAVLLFDLACYYKEFGISEDWYNFFYTVSSIMVICCVLYLLFKVFNMSYQQNQIVRQMEMQLRYSQNLASGDNKLREFRHDYKNHLVVMNSYLDNGRIEEAREYLEGLNESISESLRRISTGNFVVDAVINNKAHYAQGKDISISFSGNIPDIGVSPQDLCLIFSNLIDNAIEACEKLSGEKIIDIEVGLRQNFFILSISNPCASAPIKRNGKIKTTKNDKSLHGIGLKNVSVTAEKYSGVLVTDYSNGVFCADVRLPIKQALEQI